MRVVYSASHLRHDPQVEVESFGSHPPFEHGERAERIRDALAADSAFDVHGPDEFGVAPIDAVHDPGLRRFLETAWAEYQDVVGPTHDVIADFYYRPALRRGMSDGREPSSVVGRLGWWSFEATTPLTEGTYEAARASVDVALTATQAVLDGERHAYALCRPPGHHATSRNYGGYCFLNNAAIAAHHVASTTGSKVTVLDVDYHHGNGTQEIFFERDDVQYVSLHGDPVRAYPYVIGYADETGAGRGAGCNVNIPLPPGTDDGRYLIALEQALDAIRSFGPSLLVVSLGIDTFVTDPICDFALTTEGFGRCGAAVGGLDLPTVVVQEGGYDVGALGENVRTWLTGLATRP